ncbi:13578_t:CDS:2, partial [Cetraspora pellucida]
KPLHRLSEFIIMLEEKANKSNKYCVCKECISGSSYAKAEKNKFANTQELVHHHLKNCIYFKQKYNESEQAEILSKSILVANNPKQENSDDNSEASSSKNLSEASSSKNSMATTVSCGWAFSWVENPEIKMLFEFVHSLIKLPSQKNLSGQILFESTQKITKSIKEIAQNDKDGITLAHYLCFASIIKSRTALKNLATKIEEENDDSLKDFFKSILSNISNSCLTEVLYSFGWVYQVIKSISDEAFKDYLITKLEKRWSAWEQPLLLLSFLLHPNYHIKQFNQCNDDLSFTNLEQ